MTNPIPTDWRALCAELLLFAKQAGEIAANESLWPKCDPDCSMLDRTAAALAQPEPQGPTDEELDGFVVFWWGSDTDERTVIDVIECGSMAAFARAVLARWGRPAIEPDGPAVPDGRKPASVTDQPTDKELLELMPETMRDEFSYAARTCSDAMGGRVKPGIFRVALNTAALEYAQAVLQRYGRPAIEPVPVSERLPKGNDFDAEGCCWSWSRDIYAWCQCFAAAGDSSEWTHWLPHWALPVPQQTP